MTDKSKKFRNILAFVAVIVLVVVIFKISGTKTEQPIDDRKNTYPDKELVEQDIADYVLDSSVSEDEVLRTFKNRESKSVVLRVGNEKRGLRHILMRHSGDYYQEYDPKGTLFGENTTGNQMAEGINTLILEGDTTKSASDNTVIKKVITVNRKKANYRLVISDRNEIITFFPED